MTRVGVIEYLNSLPFIAPYLVQAKKPRCTFVLAPPKHLNQAVETNRLPVSFVSSFFYLQNQKRLTLVQELGIGAKYASQSVCLFYPEKLTSFNGITVALDPESATSNAILEWYLTKVRQETPRFLTPENVNEGPFHTAFLLIGDRCLAFGHPKGYNKLDLGKVWVEQTDLPLPFAFLVADHTWAKEHSEELEEIKQDLLQGLLWSLDNKQTILELAKKQSHLKEETLVQYWDHLTYQLDKRYLDALNFMNTHLFQNV